MWRGVEGKVGRPRRTRKFRRLSGRVLQSSMDDCSVSDNLRKIQPKERLSTQDWPLREDRRAGFAHLSRELMGNPHHGGVSMTTARWPTLMSLLPRGKQGTMTLRMLNFKGPLFVGTPSEILFPVWCCDFAFFSLTWAPRLSHLQLPRNTRTSPCDRAW